MNEIMNREDLLKIAKPILFSTPMVRAIQENRKTATRRVIKELDNYDFKWGLDREPYIGDYEVYKKIAPGKWDWVTLKNQWLYDFQTAVDDGRTYLLKLLYKAGDILYVRETWCRATDGTFRYKSNIKPDTEKIRKAFGVKWRPSIHMPKEAARIFLKVTDVRIERLQDITERDVIKEGFRDKFENDIFTSGGYQFAEFWCSTIKGKDIDIYGWNANPWVEVVEFEKIEVE